jgi:flagella basal body P-ring formation protein FlgA
MPGTAAGCWLLAAGPRSARLLALLTVWILAATGAEVEARLRAEVSVTAARATLADIAELSGDVQAMADLAPLTVMDLPDLAERTVDARVVRQSLGRAATGRLTVSGTCRLRRATQAVSPEALIAAARSTVASDGDEVRITVLRTPAALAVPASASAPTLVAAPLDRARTGDIAFTVRVLDGTQEWGRALLTLRIERFRTVPVAARALRRGETVGPLDVQTRQVPVVAHAGYLDSAVAVGQNVRLPIDAGAPFTKLNLIPPREVHGGTPVTVVVERSGFTLSGGGIALADGGLGDTIQVRRTSDGRVITARVTAPGVVTPDRL